MKNFSRTCLIICTCCIIALRAITIRERNVRAQDDAKEPDDFDFEFDHFVDGTDEEAKEDEPEELASIELPLTKIAGTRTLEPDAEMLPAHYEGVKPPGVDHMEMTHLIEKEKFEAEPSSDESFTAQRILSNLDSAKPSDAFQYRFEDI